LTEAVQWQFRWQFDRRGSTRTSLSRKHFTMSSVGNTRRNAQKRIPPATRRRALELLAASRDGCTEAIMLAHGFTVEMLVELVRAGLATAKAERVVAGGKTIAVARMADHRRCAVTWPPHSGAFVRYLFAASHEAPGRGSRADSLGRHEARPIGSPLARWRCKC
jgi:hypothetical protein